MASDDAPTFDPSKFVADDKRVLAALATSGPGRTAVEISDVLRDEYGIGIHWRSVAGVLDCDRTLVARRKSEGRWRYSIMEAGRAKLRAVTGQVTLVDPTRAVSAVLSLHDLLAALQGRIRVCDPYCDSATLEHLDACPSGLPIEVLTKNLHDDGSFRRVLAATRQRRPVEIRVAPAALHDRYIIDRAGLLIIGTSLNSFGKSQCFVIRAGRDIRDIVSTAYSSVWATATGLAA